MTQLMFAVRDEWPDPIWGGLAWLMTRVGAVGYESVGELPPVGPREDAGDDAAAEPDPDD